MPFTQMMRVTDQLGERARLSFTIGNTPWLLDSSTTVRCELIAGGLAEIDQAPAIHMRPDRAPAPTGILIEINQGFQQGDLGRRSLIEIDQAPASTKTLSIRQGQVSAGNWSSRSLSTSRLLLSFLLLASSPGLRLESAHVFTGGLAVFGFPVPVSSQGIIVRLDGHGQRAGARATRRIRNTRAPPSRRFRRYEGTEVLGRLTEAILSSHVLSEPRSSNKSLFHRNSHLGCCNDQAIRQLAILVYRHSEKAVWGKRGAIKTSLST
ncbi:hypothetical protein BDQ94DRAFT_184582 [Aspergillus welwitschiae]|uniref:Uncharacterized protein n=1 Tax=Aspergillus welwitschiae TaxID=1341132 RepID=A0A3F3PM58_9EURO|nr:hypothetical protein BDQ94DRAFT_184582 [Aspergillus welwitschiae]RDH27446.1 hypothetical protein BDQ94DRAFT_184582 [Aspergillus welwitschiae]